MKYLISIFGVLMLGGCVSAGNTSKICTDLNVVHKIVSAVDEDAGKFIADYTPKKCVNVGVAGDSGKLTGGVSAGITNE
jgi:hypothetical protein